MIGLFSWGQPKPYIMDLYSPVAMYSLRKLRSTYTGYAVRVRRSTDNAEQDIGFTPDGDFNGAAFTTFIGAGNGFAVTWYDQSLNGHDATQSTASLQFQIQINVINGRAAVGRPGALVNNSLMTVANPFSSINHWASFQVIRITSTTANGYLHGQLALDNKSYLRIDCSINTLKTSANNGETGYTNNAFSNTVRNMLLTEYYTNGTTAAAYENTTLMGSASVAISKRVGWLFHAYAVAGGMNNIMAGEFIFFNTVLPTIDRVQIQAEIGSYYGLF